MLGKICRWGVKRRGRKIQKVIPPGRVGVSAKGTPSKGGWVGEGKKQENIGKSV